MECLGHTINQVDLEGIWKPIMLSRNGPPLSHLFFADDLILFSEASEGHIRVIMECMNMFCVASSKKINLTKSSIAFSVVVDEEMHKKNQGPWGSL